MIQTQAFIQKVIPKPNRVYAFNLDDWSGGLVNNSHQLKGSEATDLLNMAFSDTTLMERRRGFTYFNDIDVGSSITFIGDYRPYEGTDLKLIATNSELFYIDDDSAVKICDISGQLNGSSFLGKYFFADGEKLRVFGEFPQANDGDYIEVIGTPISGVTFFEVSNPPSNFTPLGSAHYQGVTKYNYTEGKVWYEPCENELASEYLDNNIIPENCSYVINHNGRLYISGNTEADDTIYLSYVNNPYYFAEKLSIQLPPNSDIITGMVTYDNAVIIGRKDDMYGLYGNTNIPSIGADIFQLKKINTHCGFANVDSYAIAHNYLFFLGSDGNTYALGTTRMEVRLVHTTLLNKYLNLFKSPLNFTKDDISTSKTFFYDGEWYISINEFTIIYNYDTRSFTLYKGQMARSFGLDKGELIWGTDCGRLGSFSEDVFLDYGAPYESYWHSKWFDMGEPSVYKQFKEFFVVAHTFNDHDSDIRIKFEVDYDDVKGIIEIANEMSIWGKSKWGDRYINRNINASFPTVIGRRGRNIKIKIHNCYYSNGDVETYDDLQYYIGRGEGVVVKVIDENAYYLYNNGNWEELKHDKMNQQMKLYEINGDYEFRGKR